MSKARSTLHRRASACAPWPKDSPVSVSPTKSAYAASSLCTTPSTSSPAPHDSPSTPERNQCASFLTHLRVRLDTQNAINCASCRWPIDCTHLKSETTLDLRAVNCFHGASQKTRNQDDKAINKGVVCLPCRRCAGCR